MAAFHFQGNMGPILQTQVTGWRNDEILAEVQRWHPKSDPVMWVPSNESSTAVAAVVDFSSRLPQSRCGGTMRLLAPANHHHHHPTASRLRTFVVDNQTWLLTLDGFHACEYIGYPVVSFIGLESVKIIKEVRLIAEEAAEIERYEREQKMQEAVEAYEAWERDRELGRVFIAEVKRFAEAARVCDQMEEARDKYEARLAAKVAEEAAAAPMRKRMEEAAEQLQVRLREQREAAEREEDEDRERERLRGIAREVEAIAAAVTLQNGMEEAPKQEPEEGRAAAEEEKDAVADAAASLMKEERPEEGSQSPMQEDRKRKRDMIEDVVDPMEHTEQKVKVEKERGLAETQGVLTRSRAVLTKTPVSI